MPHRRCDLGKGASGLASLVTRKHTHAVIELERPTVTFTELSSTEVERMTEVSGSIQRVWRSRGFLPPLDGTRARFDVFDAAAIAIRYRLSLQGHVPSETREVGARYAAHVVYWAMMHTSGLCEFLAESAATLVAAERAFSEDEGLIAEIAGLDPEDAERFLIGTEKGAEILPTSDLTRMQEKLRTLSGMFIDLHLLAERFGLQAERPLITIAYQGVSRGSSPPPLRRVIGERRTPR